MIKGHTLKIFLIISLFIPHFEQLLFLYRKAYPATRKVGLVVRFIPRALIVVINLISLVNLLLCHFLVLSLFTLLNFTAWVVCFYIITVNGICIEHVNTIATS